MRVSKSWFVFSLAFALTMSCSADVVNLYFAGGQSNAKASWASAIEAELNTVVSNVELVHTNHSGNAMSQWYTTTAQANYDADFFNAGGTGVLQSRIAAIEAAGDQPIFRGFFWFQGESDTGSTNTMDQYTARYNGMLAELKSDLGISNDVDFTMALIDMNPDPFYDDPANTGGRTRGDIEYMRMTQSNICNSANGAFEDTRGYNRLDTWHLPEADLITLGTRMADTHLETFGVVEATNTVLIVSDAADGSIYGTTGKFPDSDLFAARIRGTTYNGIAFFEIPEGRVVDAELSFTCVTDEGVLTDGINLDLWALGYQSTPLMNAAWMLQADTDTRTLLNGEVPVKIAENFVDAGEATPVGSVWSTSESEGATLATYINGLTDAGAVPGDFIAIRINPDGVITNYSAGARFGASHRNNNQVPVLTLKVVEKVMPSIDTGYWSVISDDEDGAVSESGAEFNTQPLISSTGGNGPEPWSGICFFELPPQPLNDADMQLTIVTYSGDPAQGNILTNNIDLWGLGYQTTPALNAGWYISADIDGRVLLNGEKPVKIADNIAAAGQVYASGNRWSPNAAQKMNLKNYINSLFNLGADPGDYAVLRVNMDSRVYGVWYGIRWGASSDAGKEPRFTGNFTPGENRLLNPTMEMGNSSSLTFWSVSLNNFLWGQTNETPHAGSYSMRFAVGGDQTGNSANNLNSFQDVVRDDWEGKRVTFSCYARHNASEPMVTNSVQKMELRIWFLNSSGGTISTADSTTEKSLLPTDPQDVYKRLDVAGTAPAGTAKVRAMFIFRTGTADDPSITTGAVLVDDAKLEIFEPLPNPKILGTVIIFR